jgi:uncharacterized membrane protein YfcA
MEHWVAAYAWAAYLAIGIVVGFAAGLLGIGGGMVMVPLLVYVLVAQGLTDHALHMALATAIAAIGFTSLSSVRAHHAFGAVDWPAVRAMAPGTLAGSFAAALITGLIPARPLAIVFTALVFLAATQLLPSPIRLFGAAAVIGGVSSALSAGGAFMSIPFLAWCGVPLRRAIGSAAAIGFPIAVAGTAGHVIQGLRTEGLPSWTLGYVYLPALALIVVTSMAAAPLGARLAHRLAVKRLRIVFAALLYVMALQMLAGFW